MELVLVSDKNPVNLARRYVNTPLSQLFKNERLSDMTMVILVKNEAFESRIKMAINFEWYFTGNNLTIGRLPLLKIIAGVTGSYQ